MWLSWLGIIPQDKKLWVWFPSCPGFEPARQFGHVQGATNRCFSFTPMFLSVSFSLPSPFSNKFLEVYDSILSAKLHFKKDSLFASLIKIKLLHMCIILLGTTLPGFRSCNPPWQRLTETLGDANPLRRQSLSPWQERHLCPLYFTLPGPQCMTG